MILKHEKDKKNHHRLTTLMKWMPDFQQQKNCLKKMFYVRLLYFFDLIIVYLLFCNVHTYIK